MLFWINGLQIEVINYFMNRSIKEGLIWPLFAAGGFYLLFVGVLTILFGKMEKKLDYFKA